jgi:hypothetical protein
MKKLFFTAILAACFSVADAQTNRFIEASTVVDAEKILSDTLYSARVYVTFKDVKGIVPNFVKDTNVVSSNLQTGFQVDAQREQAITELVERVND